MNAVSVVFTLMKNKKKSLFRNHQAIILAYQLRLAREGRERDRERIIIHLMTDIYMIRTSTFNYTMTYLKFVQLEMIAKQGRKFNF